MNDFVRNLMENESEVYKQVVALLQYMRYLEVDLRLVDFMKMLIFKKASKDAANEKIGLVDADLAKDCVMSTVRSYPKSGEITEKVLQFIKDNNSENKVSLYRVDVLNQFVQCYPLIVKKNKNASPGMEFVMTDQNPKYERI